MFRLVSNIIFYTIRPFLVMCMSDKTKRPSNKQNKCAHGTRHLWHQAQAHCPILGDCFDPGNVVYELMWKLLVPEFRSTRYYWSTETWGDIAEGMLAVGLGVVRFDTSQVDDSVPKSLGLNVAWLARLIDELAGWVWDVTVNFPFHADLSSLQQLHILAKNQAVQIHGRWPADSNWPTVDSLRRCTEM